MTTQNPAWRCGRCNRFVHSFPHGWETSNSTFVTDNATGNALYIEESRAKLLEIMISLKERGAEGIILGCTEIELLVSAADLHMPLFPTAKLHAEKAIQWALR